MDRRMFVALALVCAFGTTPAVASTITLGVSSPVNAGSSFNVLVQVTNVFSGRAPGDVVVGFGFDVAVGNPAVFQFVDATVGPLFLPLALGTPMVAGFALNPLGIGPGDFSGPLTLATLHFNALAAGTSSLGVTWDSGDLNQGLVFLDLPVGAISASTNVQSVASVPEPSTLILMIGPALGLLKCASSARVQKKAAGPRLRPRRANLPALSA